MLQVYKNTKGLIFDCDGTLADTMPLHWQAWRDAFKAYGAECPLEFLRELGGIPAPQIVQLFNNRFEHNLDVDVVAREKNNLVKQKLLQAKPFEPVTQIVKNYKGVLPMVVASGGTRVNVENIIKAIGLLGYFDVIITADDDVEPKPSPDIFLAAAKAIDVKPRACQVFEDGVAGIEAAEKAGMVVVDVRPYV